MPALPAVNPPKILEETGTGHWKNGFSTGHSPTVDLSR